nr:MAG TPA: hypothetical protein [Bacteriophage sp.]
MPLLPSLEGGFNLPLYHKSLLTAPIVVYFSASGKS